MSARPNMPPTWLSSVVACVAACGLAQQGSAQSDAASGSPTQRQEPMPLAAAVTFGTIRQVALSPDGRWLAYVVRRIPGADASGARHADIWTGRPKGLYNNLSVYVVALTGAPQVPRLLSGGAGASWGVAWAPNSATLAFYSTRSGRPRLWLWETTGAALRCLCAVDVSRGVDRLEWTLDSRAIVAAIMPRDVDAADQPKHLWDQAATEQSIVVHQAGLPGSDTLARDWAQTSDLAVIAINTGVVQRVVTGSRIVQHVVSPDGAAVAYVVSHGMHPSTYNQVLSLEMVSVPTGTPLLHHALKAQQQGIRLAWAPSGRRLLAQDTDGDMVYTIGANVRSTRLASDSGTCVAAPREPPRDVQADSVRCLSWHGGKVQRDDGRAGSGAGWCLGWTMSGDALVCLTDDSVAYVGTGDFRVHMAAARPSNVAELVPDAAARGWYGATLYFLTSATLDRQARIDAIDPTTGVDHLVRRFPPRASIGLAAGVLISMRSAASDPSCLVYLRKTADDPPDLWCLSVGVGVSDSRLASDRTADITDRQLTHLNPDVQQYAVGENRLVSWHNVNGVTVSGVLRLPPARFAPPYPVIATVYPWDQQAQPDYYDEFNTTDLSRVLATRGYAVFTPNAGPAGPRTARNASDQTGTVVPGILKLADAGVIDLARVGIIGKSSGAVEVMELMTRSSLFKAAVSESGDADRVAFGSVMEDSTIAFGQGLASGSPPDLYRDRADVIERSPVFYFDQVQTPLLVIQGTRDEVGPPFLAEEIFVRLRQLGKPVEYVSYDGETHEYEWWSYAHQLDRLTRVLEWFDRYVMHPVTRALTKGAVPGR